MTQRKIVVLSSVLCMTIAACSSFRPSPGSRVVAAATQVSSFEITYSLGGRNLHKLAGYSTGVMGAKTVAQAPKMAAYLDRSVIEEHAIGTESYNRYFTKVLDFTQRTQRAPSQDHECRTPYTIVVKISEKTYTSKGCRSRDDDVSFGKMVHEGEFLLYSKK